MNTNPNNGKTLEDIALGADFLGLIEAFKINGDFISTEGLMVFACHHKVADFQQLGWIEPATCGRFLRGWKPAGKVAECLARCRSARTANEECDIIDRGMRNAECGTTAPVAAPDSALGVPRSALEKGVAA